MSDDEATAVTVSYGIVAVCALLIGESGLALYWSSRLSFAAKQFQATLGLVTGLVKLTLLLINPFNIEQWSVSAYTLGLDAGYWTGVLFVWVWALSLLQSLSAKHRIDRDQVNRRLRTGLRWLLVLWLVVTVLPTTLIHTLSSWSLGTQLTITLWMTTCTWTLCAAAMIVALIRLLRVAATLPAGAVHRPSSSHILSTLSKRPSSTLSSSSAPLVTTVAVAPSPPLPLPPVPLTTTAVIPSAVIHPAVLPPHSAIAVRLDHVCCLAPHSAVAVRLDHVCCLAPHSAVAVRLDHVCCLPQFRHILVYIMTFACCAALLVVISIVATVNAWNESFMGRLFLYAFYDLDECVGLSVLTAWELVLLRTALRRPIARISPITLPARSGSFSAGGTRRRPVSIHPQPLDGHHPILPQPPHTTHAADGHHPILPPPPHSTHAATTMADTVAAAATVALPMPLNRLPSLASVSLLASSGPATHPSSPRRAPLRLGVPSSSRRALHADGPSTSHSLSSAAPQSSQQQPGCQPSQPLQHSPPSSSIDAEVRLKSPSRTHISKFLHQHHLPPQQVRPASAGTDPSQPQPDTYADASPPTIFRTFGPLSL